MSTLVRTPLFLVYIATINLASSIGSPANADVVTERNNAALDAIRAGNTAPPIASRGLAILHAAIYDAVNGIARTHEHCHGGRCHLFLGRQVHLPFLATGNRD
jgi:hypothetical protein